MSQKNSKQIKETFLEYLSGKERLMAIGVFKKVPTTWMCFLTRGIAWFWAEEFYVAVTDQRLILLPDLEQKDLGYVLRQAAVIDFDEVNIAEGPFQSTILDIQKHNQLGGLKLRFKPGYSFMGNNKFDFIAAVMRGKEDFVAAQP